jgi:hypothetical protein
MQGCSKCKHGAKALHQEPCAKCWKHCWMTGEQYVMFECDHRWITYTKISYPGVLVCTRCSVFKEVIP